MTRIIFYLSLIITASCLISACGGSSNSAEVTSANTNLNGNSNANLKPEPPKNPQTPFEKALFSIRVGDFEQVLVFERKDKNVLTKEDKDFLRANSPNEIGREVNRWAVAEDNKQALAGTNFRFTNEQIAALQKRFDVKDYSAGDGVDINLEEYTAAEKARLENASQNKK